MTLQLKAIVSEIVLESGRDDQLVHTVILNMLRGVASQSTELKQRGQSSGGLHYHQISSS